MTMIESSCDPQRMREMRFEQLRAMLATVFKVSAQDVYADSGTMKIVVNMSADPYEILLKFDEYGMSYLSKQGGPHLAQFMQVSAYSAIALATHKLSWEHLWEPDDQERYAEAMGCCSTIGMEVIVRRRE